MRIPEVMAHAVLLAVVFSSSVLHAGASAVSIERQIQNSNRVTYSRGVGAFIKNGYTIDAQGRPQGQMIYWNENNGMKLEAFGTAFFDQNGNVAVRFKDNIDKNMIFKVGKKNAASWVVGTNEGIKELPNLPEGWRTIGSYNELDGTLTNVQQLLIYNGQIYTANMGYLNGSIKSGQRIDTGRDDIGVIVGPNGKDNLIAIVRGEDGVWREDASVEFPTR